MRRAARLPLPKIEQYPVRLGLGLDTESSPLEAKPGYARASLNYEVAFGGGFERMRGFERFDGRPRPSDALYEVLVPQTSFNGVSVGDTVVGASSAATGVVAYIDAGFIAVTKVTGVFNPPEALAVGGNSIGSCAAAEPSITAQQDNQILAAAAGIYRADIGQVPGSGPIRGIATLGANVFAWRDNAGATGMVIHKATASGWSPVPLYYELSFTGGSGAPPAEGATISKSGVSATVKRVVLQSGSWSGGTAAGRFIITQPSGGAFTAGAFTGGVTATIPGAGAGVYLGTQIALLPGGRVETIAHNFTGSQDTRRLYGCDTVNREFEFDGDVLVPIVTGMTFGAKFVVEHANYLWFAYKGSLQRSAAGSPHQWSVVVGAGELGIGDEITGLAKLPSSPEASALAVAGRDSVKVLYGNSTGTFSMAGLSEEAGVQPYSLQCTPIPVGLDVQGFRELRSTDRFGNFVWDSRSQRIDRIARNRTAVCSVFVRQLGRYRLFMAGGEMISGTPTGKEIGWTTASLGIDVRVAYNGEVSGVPRTFYGTADGWVMEADVGRSFDGQPIQHALRLVTMTAGSPMVEKRFRDMDVEAAGDGAFTLYATAEYDDGNPNNDLVSTQLLSLTGQGGRWDTSLYGQARWDAAGDQRKLVEIPGIGYGVAPIFFGESAVELSHALKSAVILFSNTKVRKS